jgi:hypothetical protein
MAQTMNTLELQQKLAALNSKPPPKPPAEEPASSPPKTRIRRAAAVSPDTGRENKAHIGAWLHKDFKRSLLLVRAQTGEDVQTIIARALNAEFRAHNVPVVDD